MGRIDIEAVLLSKLEKVRVNGPERWMACCPAHDDRNPSLSIRFLGDQVVMKCFAGCDNADVLSSIGLGFPDLYSDEDRAAYKAALEHAADKLEKNAQRPDPVQRARSALAWYDAKRKRGEKLTPKEMEQEMAAFNYLRNRGQNANR